MRSRCQSSNQVLSYLDGAENGMGLADNANNYRTLLYSFGSIFNLEYSALGRARRCMVSLGASSNETAPATRSANKGRIGESGRVGVQCDRIVIVIVAKHDV